MRIQRLRATVAISVVALVGLTISQGMATASDIPEAPETQSSADAHQSVVNTDWEDQAIGKPTSEELTMMAPSWPQTETNQILADAGITPTVTEEGTSGFSDVYGGSAYQEGQYVIFYKADAAPERVAEFLAIMAELEAQDTPIPLAHRPVEYSEAELSEWARQASLGGAELAARLGVEDIAKVGADLDTGRIIIYTSGPTPRSWPERLNGPNSPLIVIEGNSDGIASQLSA